MKHLIHSMECNDVYFFIIPYVKFQSWKFPKLANLHDGENLILHLHSEGHGECNTVNGLTTNLQWESDGKVK